MKLLLDENLAPKLAKVLSDLYPDSRHVSECALQSTSDQAVWEFALANGFVIVSKDSDFEQRSVLRDYSVVIHTFYHDAIESMLVLP